MIKPSICGQKPYTPKGDRVMFKFEIKPATLYAPLLNTSLLSPRSDR
jgi:hypothetical protein